ncbi:MAG: C4-dicarboxylate ABC transporter, partial [Xanthomonadaceae bacterium]|nr:C4-dicarboxylate ABC transporter [Xanthomonadaceae bacterium]
PMYWGAVFPLGMYAASTHRMIDALQLPFLARLPQAMFAIGMAAWALLFAGQLRALYRQWRTADG